MLKLPQAKEYPLKENPKMLAGFLVKRLYGLRLDDIEQFSEDFKIESEIATLTVLKEKSDLVATKPEYALLVKNFKEVKELTNRLRTSLRNLTQRKIV